MSNPDINFDPENVKEEDNYDHEVEVEKADEDKEREEHFTREPDNFGGQHYL